MPRTMATVMQDAAAATVVEPFFAVELYFPTETLRLWTGNYNITISGNVYLGAGDVLSLSEIQETGDIQAAGATLGITGIPSNYLSMALSTQYQGRACRIYFGIVSSPSNMVEVFSGEIDTMDIDERGDTCAIMVSVENILVLLERPVVRRFTHEDQQTRYPGDLGLEFVASLQDKEIFFGRKSA
jgi:hypothetical protein